MPAVQAPSRSSKALRVGHAASAALLLALAGCGDTVSLNPISWWHDLEGGRIAEDRPPPPNVDAPYPNLGSVPTRPQAIDAATRGRIANGLVADRANAQYGASQAPLGSVPARPAALPPSTGTLSASLPAASAPPLSGSPQGPPPADIRSAPPRPAPIARVETSALPPPAAPTPDAAPMPIIPAGPPPPPGIAGVPASVAPTPPPATPPALPAPPPPPGVPLAVPFTAGSAALSPAAQASLKALAATHGAAPIAVTGYGEATGSEAAAQIAAMPLAWLRAQAISGALQSAGVPLILLRVTAEAGGRGGVARVAN